DRAPGTASQAAQDPRGGGEPASVGDRDRSDRGVSREEEGRRAMNVKGVYEKRPGIWYFHVSHGGRQIHRRGGSFQAAVRGRERAQERIDLGLAPFPEKKAEPA